MVPIFPIYSLLNGEPRDYLEFPNQLVVFVFWAIPGYSCCSCQMLGVCFMRLASCYRDSELPDAMKHINTAKKHDRKLFSFYVVMYKQLLYVYFAHIQNYMYIHTSDTVKRYIMQYHTPYIHIYNCIYIYTYIYIYIYIYRYRYICISIYT